MCVNVLVVEGLVDGSLSFEDFLQFRMNRSVGDLGWPLGQ